MHDKITIEKRSRSILSCHVHAMQTLQKDCNMLDVDQLHPCPIFLIPKNHHHPTTNLASQPPTWLPTWHPGYRPGYQPGRPPETPKNLKNTKNPKNVNTNTTAHCAIPGFPLDRTVWSVFSQPAVPFFGFFLRS